MCVFTKGLMVLSYDPFHCCGIQLIVSNGAIVNVNSFNVVRLFNNVAIYCLFFVRCSANINYVCAVLFVAPTVCLIWTATTCI